MLDNGRKPGYTVWVAAIDYNARYRFVSKGEWFKAGTECLVEDGHALWCCWDGNRPDEITYEEMVSRQGEIMGIFTGTRVCDDDHNERSLGYQPGDERQDGEVCGLDEFAIEVRP